MLFQPIITEESSFGPLFLPGVRPASGFMFEDHAVEQGADDAFLIGVEEGDGLELELEVLVGAALIFAEQLQIRTHLESDGEAVDHVYSVGWSHLPS